MAAAPAGSARFHGCRAGDRGNGQEIGVTQERRTEGAIGNRRSQDLVLTGRKPEKLGVVYGTCRGGNSRVLPAPSVQ
ncbi:MAG: hypothetical protein JRE64_27555 [Deltaproteobacteria bacterium]|nr:hypothetical protein [Deltaproteobacteria bacterium]